MIEKFEIDKNGKSMFFTGTIHPVDNDRVEIRTIRGETLRFYKDQVVQSFVLPEKGNLAINSDTYNP